MKYKIADTVFNIAPIYKYTVRHCEQFRCCEDEPCECEIIIEQKDIDSERERDLGNSFPDAYYESMAVFRKICEYLLENDKGIIFHCSAIAVDNKAYLFTAPSGTGKSTHAKLWKELLGDRLVYVNDDKPIIRYIDNAFYVYGTPWMGKHSLGSNIKCKIEAICEIYQSKENVISRLQPKDMVIRALSQTLMPEKVTNADNLFAFLDKMLKSVKLYKLGCNMDISAAKLSYETMSRGDRNED